MEVGAVKQAFNNEVIHLKKSLNQAKIHTIHKLTRKAKTFNNKKASDKLKDKLKRKAEAAVNEVLIIKKIKPRDVARFIVTHKGEIADYINKPEVDQNKACARLLLHKAMQEKYKTIRDRFGNIPINDLLMSRHERRKLKKEMKEKQNDKRKGKNQTESNQAQVKKDEAINNDDNDEVNSSDEASEDSGNELNDHEDGVSDSGDKILNRHTPQDADTEDEDMLNSGEYIDKKTQSSEDEMDHDDDNDDNDDNHGQEEDEDDEDDDDEDDNASVFGEEIPIENVVKSNPIKVKDVVTKVKNAPTLNKNKKTDKRKENKNKNKNINEKISKRNFNKQVDESPKIVKIVDPFFKTSSGDNYMSLAEPRAPDEFKEVHKQGNRQYRRAVMFGHVPKSKPRHFNQDHNKNRQLNKFNKNDSDNRSNDRFNRNNKSNSFNNDNRNNKFNKEMPRDQVPEKPEKLHPSWEAKKKLSSVLPFQGKKIKFDDS